MVARDRFLSVAGLLIVGGLALAGFGRCLLGPCPLSGAQAAVLSQSPAAVVTKVAPVRLRTDHFAIGGMFCANCARLVTEEVRKIPGVTGVEVDYGTGKGTITYEAGKVDSSQLIQAIKKAGYQATKS